MKIENAKVGVRVVIVTNAISDYGVLSGDTGTIAEADGAEPRVQWDAHTGASYDKRWAANAKDLRVLKPKHFPVGTKVVLVAEGCSVGVPVGSGGTVTIAAGTTIPKVKYEGSGTYWTEIHQLGLVNE